MMMDVSRFEKLPLIGILRDVNAADIEPLLETSIKAGLEAIEVTMNTPGAPEMISGMCKISEGRIMVGAGTVLTKKDLETALEAGAGFIVMPVLIDSIVELCVKKKVPVFPGALTPGEVFKAYKAGATMVKVFPSGVFGPGYIKMLKGPFKDIKLMAVGGVNAENAGEYFANGASAVAFGAGIFKREWLEKKDFASVGKLVKKFVTVVKEACGKSEKLKGRSERG